LVAGLLWAAVLAACATSPLGRSQLILFPESEMSEMGAAAFQEMKQQTPPVTDAGTNRYVQCVADHIIRALPGEDPAGWEVRVFDDEQVNAFALPGRKIGVYRGLLDVAENQSQLATVIGHEVAHVLAKHSNERVSTNYAVGTGMQVVQIATGADTAAKQQLYGLLGLGVQVGVLMPFSRSQEAEADLLGLDLMADAGFDPRESVKLWQNMNEEGGAKPPEFMSTHPSGERRISELNARMSGAMQRSLRARSAGHVPDCD
jgi:predicted Zn-dependent protease